MCVPPVNRSERQPEARPLKDVDVCKNLNFLQSITRSLHWEVSTVVTGSELGPGNEYARKCEMVEGALFHP